MKMNLENIHILDMIHLHKQARDIIYTDILKATLKVSMMHSSKSKIENHLKKEKVENKAHQQQIKKMQTYLFPAISQVDKGATKHKLLNEKENTIHLLKKKVKIPSTQLIQASELTDLEKEKQTLNGELNDCNEKLLKSQSILIALQGQCCIRNKKTVTLSDENLVLATVI